MTACAPYVESRLPETYKWECTLYKYSIGRNFLQEKIFANFTTCSCWRKFICKFLFCINYRGYGNLYLSHYHIGIPLNISAIQRYLGLAKFLSSENFRLYGMCGKCGCVCKHMYVSMPILCWCIAHMEVIFIIRLHPSFLEFLITLYSNHKA